MRVNIVAPSLTVSDMGNGWPRPSRALLTSMSWTGGSPFGRVSVPDDVAAAVCWLVSDANPYASGQKINIDGGVVARSGRAGMALP